MKIAIAGYGIEGKANYDYWSKDSSNEVTIVDESENPKFQIPTGAKVLLGAGVFEKLSGFDLVIRTAGLAPEKIKTDGKVWTGTNEFFEKCPAPIIGVTGTKGKGTTASLIESIFKASGKKTWLIGNIGVSAIEALPSISNEDIVVFELSSFQLWDIKRSPHVAVVLMIEPDHLNIHTDMADYTEAKANIRKFQSDDDYCIYHPTNQYSKAVALSYNKGKSIRYNDSDDKGVYEKDGSFYQGEQEICSIDKLQIIGQHNVENATAAMTVAKIYGVDNQSIATGLESFKGLEHHIEFVKDVEGVSFYNDSFSSAPGATIAAIRSFDRPEVVILGGAEKGSDYTQLAEEIKNRTNIKEVVLVGQVRQKLADILKEVGVSAKVTVLEAENMKDIVEYSYRAAGAGDVVLLSPGCASFGMFKDFYDRGRQFKNEVNSL